MILRNVEIFDTSEKKTKTVSIYIKGQVIARITDSVFYDQQTSIDLGAAIAIPGLINSHDHLEFNLFPLLKSRVYSNYIEWAKSLEEEFLDKIRIVQQIPSSVRVQYGIYKNLINGVTSVVHHGNLYPEFENSLIDVVSSSFKTIHSLRFHNKWHLDLWQSYFNCKPVVIHLGEGVDVIARKEISTYIKYNFFKKRTIAVHGIGMDAEQVKKMQALVWCPVSNYELYNKTACIEVLKHNTSILFGTDSTLTATWNIWEHLRFARKQKMLSDTELYDSFTSLPARVWNLRNTGEIKESKLANLVILRSHLKDSFWDNLYASNPHDILLVLRRGQILLFDEDLVSQVSMLAIDKFSIIQVGGRKKYILGNITDILNTIRFYCKDSTLFSDLW